MKGGPRISVLMTVYNGARVVTRSLESVIKQEFDSNGLHEIVVVDDGSVDETATILAVYSRKHSNVRVLRPGRVGRAKALNLGLAACRAPYVAINDADDCSWSQRLRLQMEYLDAHPDVVLVAGWARVLDATGRQIGEKRLPDNDRFLRRRLALGNPFIHSTITYRRAALEQVGGFNEAKLAAIDYDAIERVARTGRIAVLESFVTDHVRSDRQYFRSQMDRGTRWRSAAAVAVSAAAHHAWLLAPLSVAIYAAVWMPLPESLWRFLSSLHGRFLSRYRLDP